MCYRYTHIKKLKSFMVAVCTNFRVVLISRDKEKVKDWERGFGYINDVYFLGEKKIQQIQPNLIISMLDIQISVRDVRVLLVYQKKKKKPYLCSTLCLCGLLPYQLVYTEEFQETEPQSAMLIQQRTPVIHRYNPQILIMFCLIKTHSL